MIDRKIKLTFNKKKPVARAIRTKISQKLFISSILFSIYIRFLFSKIRNKAKYANIKMPSFIETLQLKTNQKSQNKIANS